MDVLPSNEWNPIYGSWLQLKCSYYLVIIIKIIKYIYFTPCNPQRSAEAMSSLRLLEVYEVKTSYIVIATGCQKY